MIALFPNSSFHQVLGLRRLKSFCIQPIFITASKCYCKRYLICAFELFSLVIMYVQLTENIFIIFAGFYGLS